MMPTTSFVLLQQKYMDKVKIKNSTINVALTCVKASTFCCTGINSRWLS
jgi:hypothetical protein